MMAEYLPLEQFKAIYVVDLCKSLCDEARKKVAAKGWKNVHVVEGDACTFAPPRDEKVTLVTFSYSLSSAHAAFPLCAPLHASTRTSPAVHAQVLQAVSSTTEAGPAREPDQCMLPPPLPDPAVHAPHCAQ